MAHSTGIAGADREAEARVALHGCVAGPPRALRTTDGWEVASLLVGGRDGTGDPHATGAAAVLAVCAGTGAAVALDALRVGDEVVVVGRLRARRAARPEDDAVELDADAVLARSGPVSATAVPPEPRIAP
ncbi:hypothetical protein ACMA46_09480 [Clavibacter sp. Sh2141]|uniref:hypothetical protein n=1 Tax=Clavibacter sp. Sh2141 TaxID=3395374 RepID=UPI0039BD5D3A